MTFRTRQSRRAARKFAVGRALALLFLSSALLALPHDLLSQDDPPDEYQVKLAFLYNFTKFVEWPEQAFSSAKTPLVICVVGTDPFGKALEDDLATRRTAGHPITVRRLGVGGDFSGCHITFVRAEERKHLAAILSRLNGHDVLTVGEMSGFLEGGGQVNFDFTAQSLHFNVNLVAVRQTRLKLSSKLLALARNLANP